jgi:hypothetical protein
MAIAVAFSMVTAWVLSSRFRTGSSAWPFRYQPVAEPDELGNGGRLKWVSGHPGEAPAYAGTDFIIVKDGRIAALYLFFDKLP